jgi:hypothetical protein
MSGYSAKEFVRFIKIFVMLMCGQLPAASREGDLFLENVVSEATCRVEKLRLPDRLNSEEDSFRYCAYDVRTCLFKITVFLYARPCQVGSASQKLLYCNARTSVFP